MDQSNQQLIEHLFRTEYGKLVALITRFFGPSHIQIAEDVVQDTLISALSNWGTIGVPSNPSGWLYQVAKHKMLNEIERNNMKLRHHHTLFEALQKLEESDSIFLDDEIEDSQLRMIFTCSHSSLDIKSQIALTLKTLCGFGVKEIAKALLDNEVAINKRLYRAKEKIRNSKSPFGIPQGKELSKKIESVSTTLYLLFNEGYNSTRGDSVIQKELCLEAIRLTNLLVNHFDDNRKLLALLSLMCFHTARFNARIDNKGTIILFEDQDRSLWNQELIHKGMHYFKKSLHDIQLSVYHVEARIAAEHCLSQSFEHTNWQVIYDQYILLSQLKPNPIIHLNLAIIQSQLKDLESAISELRKLEENLTLKDYHLLPATQGVFYLKLEQPREALAYFKKSLKLSPSKKEEAFIKSKVKQCEKLLPKTD